MYPRTNYEMTEADLETILNACKPVPMIMLQCGRIRSPQERANAAWAELGMKMGFDSMTVEPIPGKCDRFFTAVPSEMEAQRQAREADEATNRRKIRAAEICGQIDALKRELNALIPTI